MVGIQVENIHYQYRTNAPLALDNINLHIPAATCVGLIGPNGAGKSTLLSILSGLLQPSSGTIRFTQHQDKTSSQQKFIQQHIALVPQEYAFYFPLSVRQNLMYFASLCTPNRQQRQNAVDRVIQQTQLQKVINQKASVLSGGYKRRLNLAIALLKDPLVLYLDEPTVGVDPVSRKAILALIQTLKEQGKTIIFTSHMLSEIESHCDEIFMLKQGQVLQFSNTQHGKLLEVTFTAPLSDTMKTALEQQGCVIHSPKTLQYIAQSNGDISNVIQLIGSQGIQIQAMQYGQSSLTEQYLQSMEQYDPTEH